MKFLKRAGWKALAWLGLDASVALVRDSALAREGWFDSYRTKRSVDAAGRPVPWYTYPAIHFLEPRLTKDMDVFEYGCGNSTIWYAQKVRSVISVENDQEWHANVSRILPGNAQVIMRNLEGQQYASEVVRSGRSFDVAVIDGRDRVECTRFAIRSLKEEGVVVFDNSERPEYSEAFSFLAGHAYKKLDFEGMGPINSYSWTTSILYRPGNCLGI
jgi:hypothetical protein